MKAVVLERHFIYEPRTNSLIVDLSKCSTPEEMVFKSEIENALSTKKEYVDNASEETLDILTGHNRSSFNKLVLLWGTTHQITNGTIEYGPTIAIN